MHSRPIRSNQTGFSMVEMVIAISVMLIITGGVMSLMKSSMVIATASYEMTEAQEHLRVAQEYINRDLINAGDGMKSMSVIRIPTAFATTYLAQTLPAPDPLENMPTLITNLGILTSDNNVITAGTGAPVPVIGAVPAANIRILPDGVTGTDRQTILEIDPQFTPVTPSAIDLTGTTVTLPSGTDMTQFNKGEIYFVTSSRGGTFATITDIIAATTGTTPTPPKLTFATGSPDLGLNISGTQNNLKAISNSGALATSLQRMQIIHYYVDSSGFLMRRVFGVKGIAWATGVNNSFRDSIIAEHVLNVQFKYSLETTDSAGIPLQPTSTLETKAQRLGARQVEVTVTVETPHVLQNNARSNISMTTSTSVRNMQFRQATQPAN
jgi:Tfp pilus assembly protein PilW